MLCHRDASAPLAAPFLDIPLHHIVSAGDFFMRRFLVPCRYRRHHAGWLLRRRLRATVSGCRSASSNAAAAPASASSSVPSPISVACCVSTVCRRTATLRPSARSASISASPRNWHWPGACWRRSARLGPGDLSGDYVGAQGSASVGVGVGGNVLVGGSANSIALQPLSVQGQVGVNVAAGLESLELRPGR